MPTASERRIHAQQDQADAELARGNTVTEDASEAQLVSFAEIEETVVYWFEHGEKVYGIIYGYDSGVFNIEPVAKQHSGHSPSGWTWVETNTGTRNFRRHDFVVYGPADRGESVNWRTSAAAMSGPSALSAFVGALTDALAAKQEDTGEAAFEARLDVSMDDEANKEMRRHTGYLDGPAPRRYRLLIKPTMQPMLQSEIEQVLKIAEDHNLYVWHNNAGLEIRLPTDIPS